MFGLCPEILFHPHLSVKMRIIDEGQSLLRSLFNHLRSDFLLADSKERILVKVIPEDTDARHLLVKGLHVSHLSLMFIICELCHNYAGDFFPAYI